MNGSVGVLLEVAVMVLRAITRQFTPLIKIEIKKMICRVAAKAKATNNKFDDIGVDLLANILEIDLNQCEESDKVTQRDYSSAKV